MPAIMRNTVDRLDKPSAYYLGKVCPPFSAYDMKYLWRGINANERVLLQNKKRKFDRDRDDREEREKTPEEQEDPLKDATTLYVGNLSVLKGWGNPGAIDC